MERNGSGVSALLGLDGLVVGAQLLDEVTGEWWLAVETVEDRAWCPTCGIRAVGHGRRRVKVGALPIADRLVVLVWAKRLWRCSKPAAVGLRSRTYGAGSTVRRSVTGLSPAGLA